MRLWYYQKKPKRVEIARLSQIVYQLAIAAKVVLDL